MWYLVQLAIILSIGNQSLQYVKGSVNGVTNNFYDLEIVILDGSAGFDYGVAVIELFHLQKALGTAANIDYAVMIFTYA